MSLQQAFSNLQSRDLIACGPGVAFVVVRDIKVEGVARNVLGRLCSSRDPYAPTAHVEGVLPATYAWDVDLGTFSDTDGQPLPMWNDQSYVERGAYSGNDLDKAALVLLADDCAPCDVSEPSGEVLDKLNSIFRLSPNEVATFVSAASLFGITLNQEQVCNLFVVMEMLETAGQTYSPPGMSTQEVHIATLISALAGANGTLDAVLKRRQRMGI